MSSYTYIQKIRRYTKNCLTQKLRVVTKCYFNHIGNLKERKSTTQICTSRVWCCSSSSIFKIYLQQILGLRRLGSDNGLGFKPRFAEYIRLTSQIQKYTCHVHKKNNTLAFIHFKYFSSVFGIRLPNTLAISSL